MSDRIGIPEIRPRSMVPAMENAMAGSFTRTVELQQERWRAAKKTGWKSLREVSQAIDVPVGIPERLLDMVSENMPHYVPPDLADRVIRDHPTPIIAVGVLLDRRNDTESAQTEFKTEYPDSVQIGDRKKWSEGMSIIAEVTTELLTRDLIHNLSKKNKWFRLLDFTASKFGAYGASIKEMQRLLGGKSGFGSVKEALVSSMLSGDLSYADSAVREHGYQSLDQFALRLANSPKSWLERFMGKIPNTRLGYSLASNGFVSSGVPGVINIPLIQPLAASTAYYAFFPPAAAMTASVAGGTLPYVLIHETVHYLSTDNSHFGFFKKK